MKNEMTDWSITAEEQLRRIVAALQQENASLKTRLEFSRKAFRELKELLLEKEGLRGEGK